VGKSKYKSFSLTRRSTNTSRNLSLTILLYEDAARGAEELLITEGVTDCISAMQAGLACISPVTHGSQADVPRLLQLTVMPSASSSATIGGKRRGRGRRERDSSGALVRGTRRTVALIPKPRQGQDRRQRTRSDFRSRGAARGAGGSEVLPDYLLDRIPKETPKSELDRLLEPSLLHHWLYAYSRRRRDRRGIGQVRSRRRALVAE